MLRLKLWEENPHCHYCNKVTILPSELAKKFGVPEDKVDAVITREARWDMATIDHVFPAFKRHHARKSDNKYVLACFHCNQIRGEAEVRKLPLKEQELLARLGSKRYVLYKLSAN